jgi:hypothetical protein
MLRSYERMPIFSHKSFGSLTIENFLWHYRIHTPNPEIKEEEVAAGNTPLEAKNNSDANKITGGRHMNG